MTEINTSTEAVERLLDGVTPGPWELRHNMAKDENGEYAEGVSVVANGRFYVHEHDLGFNDDVDARIEAAARFIAAARDLVPALLAERDDLRAKVSALAESLEWYISEDYTNTGDEPMPDRGNRTWNEINAYWIEGKRKAETILAEIKGADEIEKEEVG